MARRDDREYREYLRKEQRSQRGCSAGRMPARLSPRAARTYPALEVRCDEADLVLALIDDFHPTAVEQRDGAARVFFASAAERDAARNALATRYRADPLDVPDEDWARRSQENLQPITIGRLTVFPTNPKFFPANPKSPTPNP